MRLLRRALRRYLQTGHPKRVHGRQVRRLPESDERELFDHYAGLRAHSPTGGCLKREAGGILKRPLNRGEFVELFGLARQIRSEFLQAL